MPLSYSTRLRRDLQEWQALGLIQADQSERIAAHALAPRGGKHLQVVLGLCILLLLAPAILAFVAANWAAMPPGSRITVLFLTDAACVFATYLAALRHAAGPPGSPRKLVDGLALLSLVAAAATLALIGQTFHTPADPQGYALTIAILGTATALVARSGSAGVVASLALIMADLGSYGLGLGGAATTAATGAGLWFWAVGSVLFLASLTGWIPAREFTLLVLLSTLSNHLGGQPRGLPIPPAPDRALLVAASAMALGYALPHLSVHAAWATRLRDGAQALKDAAAGLILISLVLVAFNLFGFELAHPSALGLVALAAVAGAAFTIDRLRAPNLATRSVGDFLVLAAGALALIVWVAASSSREVSSLWTVWGGIVPALMLVVAGEIDHRRALYGGGITLTAGFTLGMLAMSRSLITFSGNLLLCALVLSLALLACRWANRRISARLA